jgi:phage virion morphogenesis protein
LGLFVPALIRIQVDDHEALAALRGMMARMGNRAAFMKNAGEILVEGTRERFHTMTDPEGKPWKVLSSAYAATKKRNKGRILTLSGQLGETIRYQLEGSDTVLVGSNKPYAAIHQLGGHTGPHIIRPKGRGALFWPGAAHPVKLVRHPGSTIPARPYLGIGERDRVRLLEAAQHFLERAVSN